jgi:hypothetical protein
MRSAAVSNNITDLIVAPGSGFSQRQSEVVVPGGPRDETDGALTASGRMGDGLRCTAARS